MQIHDLFYHNQFVGYKYSLLIYFDVFCLSLIRRISNCLCMIDLKPFFSKYSGIIFSIFDLVKKCNISTKVLFFNLLKKFIIVNLYI